MIGIIYKVENLLNGEVYIGATTKSLKARKNDHLERVKRDEDSKFHVAMNIYGICYFSWKEIDVATTINELAIKEKEYIIQYDSKENGYNSDSGGGFKKTIYQYSIYEGKLISKYDSLNEVIEEIGVTKQEISRACLNVNNTFGGYYWSYEYKEPFKPNTDIRKKKIICYNLEEKKIKEYNSISEASKVTEICKSSIAKVCRGERKTAGGFKWKYY